MRLRSFVFRPSLLPTIATFVLLPSLVGLGVWQLERGAQKDALHAAFAQRAEEVPVHLNPRVEQLDAAGFDWSWWHYRRVEAAGRFVPGRQYLLDNRTRAGVAGYHVLTPMELEGTRFAVLVDRGWLPVGADRERLPSVSVAARLKALRGLVDRPRRPFLLGSAGYEFEAWPRVVQSVDLDRISGQIGRPMLPFVVLLDPDDPAGYSRQWTPYLGITAARHRGYAFQWFSLAVALIVIWVAVNLRRTPE